MQPTSRASETLKSRKAYLIEILKPSTQQKKYKNAKVNVPRYKYRDKIHRRKNQKKINRALHIIKSKKHTPSLAS